MSDHYEMQIADLKDEIELVEKERDRYKKVLNDIRGWLARTRSSDPRNPFTQYFKHVNEALAEYEGEK